MSKKTIRVILGIITFAILLTAVVFNISSVAGVILKVIGVFSSFLIGIALAFILNVPMKFIEKRLLFKIRRQKLKRALSIVATLAFCGVIIMIVVFAVVPEIIRTVEAILINLPSIGSQIQDLIDTASSYSDHIANVAGGSQFDLQKLLNEVSLYAQTHMSSLSTSLISVVADTVERIIALVIGFVFSIYILAFKEKLVRQLQMILFAYLKVEWARKIWEIILMANRTFQRFISGQCLEACILGCMFWVSMSIFRLPYAVLISALIGVLALIPIFGAFIGCAVGILLIVFVNPLQALWFVILFIVLQQIEGHCIYPFVIGTSVGLPSIWVLLAVVIGGKIFGVAGMIVFIPLCSVLYALLADNVRKRLDKKKMQISRIKKVPEES